MANKGSPFKKTGDTGSLNAKQQKLMGALLSGMTYKEAAKASGYSLHHIGNLMSGQEERFSWFLEEYKKQLEKQAKRIMEREPDRSKEALLAELEELRDTCKDGKKIDRTNWIKTIIERGKLLGYYIEKKEVTGAVQVDTPIYDFSAFSASELRQFAALEAKATRNATGA